jgi:hypothetical protein
MRLSHSLPCRLARLTFTLLMTLTWCGLARTASAAAPASGGRQAGDDPARVRHVAESLERTIKFYEKAQPTIPRDTFDPDALTRQVGSDPTKLFEWVRDNTAPAPYRGALRGAVGVLMDRSGSSLDRALLLSRLLRLAGHDARLARGTLAPDRAGALLKQVWEDPAAAPPVPPAAALDRATIAHFASQTGLDPAELAQSVEKLELDSQRRSEDLAATVAEQTEALSRLLGDPAPAAAADARAGHLAAVADHWWVQSLQDGKWVDLDPATPESKPGESLTAAVETIELTATGALPPAAVALAHEVELRIAVERTDGGASKTEVAFRHALRPAETAGAVGRLQITPMDWPTDLDLTSDPQTTMRTALLAQQRWLPVLVLDGNTIIQGSFDAHGVVDPNPVLDPMKKTGGSAAKGASDAFDVLNDAPPPAAQQPSGELTAVWLECDRPRQPRRGDAAAGRARRGDAPPPLRQPLSAGGCARGRVRPVDGLRPAPGDGEPARERPGAAQVASRVGGEAAQAEHQGPVRDQAAAQRGPGVGDGPEGAVRCRRGARHRPAERVRGPRRIRNRRRGPARWAQADRHLGQRRRCPRRGGPRGV